MRQLNVKFDAKNLFFGSSSSPLVDGNLVFVDVGGKGASVVAFDKDKGNVLWQSQDDKASYSSPIVVTRDGVKHALFITRLHFVSLDPATGKERFRTAFGKRGTTVNAANPVMIGDDVLLTGGALHGLQAVVTQYLPARERIRVLLEFMGRQMEFEVPAHSALPSRHHSLDVFAG